MSPRAKSPTRRTAAPLEFTVDPDRILRLGRDEVPARRIDLYDLQLLRHDVGHEGLRTALTRCPPLQAVVAGFAASRHTTITGDVATWALGMSHHESYELRALVADWLDTPWDWATDAAELRQDRFALGRAALVVRDQMDLTTREFLRVGVVPGRFEFDQRGAACIGMSADEATARALARDLPYRFTPLVPERDFSVFTVDERERLHTAAQVLAMEFAKLTFLRSQRNVGDYRHAIRNHIASQVREALIEVRHLILQHLAKGLHPRSALGAAAQEALTLCQRHRWFAEAAIPELESVVRVTVGPR